MSGSKTYTLTAAAAFLGCSRELVRRAAVRLEAAGKIERRYDPDRGKRRWRFTAMEVKIIGLTILSRAELKRAGRTPGSKNHTTIER